MLMAFVFSRGLNKAARSRIARVSAKGPNLEGHCDGEEKPIWFAPWNGSFWFWFRGTLLSYRTDTITTAFREEEEITIKCIGRTGKILDELMKECRQEYLRQNQNKTTVFEHRGDFWKRTATKGPRPLSSVIIPAQQKQQLVEDLKSFHDSSHRARYSGHHIPYRRGYLFYGPPGTGKSSLTSAIAAQCKLDIYIVDIPSLNDENLRELFSKLPEKCIVLLEDVDAVGADRGKDEEEHRARRNSVSLSGLLNALDGVASQEGRLLIMTTNHIEQLDNALIRPGRIDLRLELDYADSELAAQLFEFMYKPVGEAQPLSKEETLAVEGLAREFAAKIPEGKFSVAQIMSYIQQNWDSPTTALDNIGGWVKQALQDEEAKCSDDTSGLLVGPGAPSPVGEAAESEAQGLWMRSKPKEQTGLPRTRNYRVLPATAW
jgi:chaperone BCS1